MPRAMTRELSFSDASPWEEICLRARMLMPSTSNPFHSFRVGAIPLRALYDVGLLVALVDLNADARRSRHHRWRRFLDRRVMHRSRRGGRGERAQPIKASGVRRSGFVLLG